MQNQGSHLNTNQKVFIEIDTYYIWSDEFNKPEDSIKGIHLKVYLSGSQRSLISIVLFT